MTEKQIEQLRTILAASSLTEEVSQSPSDLDTQILQAAHERVSTQEGVAPFSLRALFGLPFSALVTVSLAVTLTAALFFGMSQMIVPNEPAIALVNNLEYERDTFLTRKALVKNTKVKDLVSRPELFSVHEAPSKMSRDRILMEFSLPAVSEVLAEGQFDFGQGRVAASNAIDDAMQEISAMVEIGTFDSARERYAKLLEVCDRCALPLTLEALVLDSTTPTTFDTG